MISTEWQVFAGLLLDAVVGDPRGWPHPVRLIGWFALEMETITRRSFKNLKIAGMLTAAIVVVASGLITYSAVAVGYMINPWIGALFSVFVIYTGIAAHDLAKHALEVKSALDEGNLVLARQRVGMICGRDTGALDEAAIIRATVESVAENLVDGVTAPLFYGVLAGPSGVMVYKAISTLDSTFGYRNERYLRFGWASARLDDVAAFLPSRITAFLIPLAAWILGMRSVDSFRTLRTDRRKHASPNSGYTESAFSGALGLRLGGPGLYGGVIHEKPFIGRSLVEPSIDSITMSVRLMRFTTFISLPAFLLLLYLSGIFAGWV